MGIKLENILKEISCSKNKFDQICENFTNKNLFKIDKYGKLQKDTQGNLIKINYDNIN
jgi:hypothetical protein